MANKTEKQNLEEVQQLSVDELRVQLMEARKGYYQSREDVLSGKEGNYKKLRDLKKTIARLSTVIRQKEAVAMEETK